MDAEKTQRRENGDGSLSREPVWLDAFALEFLAHAIVVELGIPVRLPTRLRVVTRRPVERRDRQRARRGIYEGTEIVRVPCRDDGQVARIVDAPRSAWRAGVRDPVVLAEALHTAIATASDVRGDRGFLAAIAVLFFLDANGRIAPSTVRDFILRMRRLAGEPGTAATRALEDLVQRDAPGSS